ncbi:family 1 glycosylhydrolase [Lacticaseibacillus pantheris]
MIDDYHIDYMRKHVWQMRETIKGGVDVFGYAPWRPTDLALSNISEMTKCYRMIYVNQDGSGRNPLILNI